MKVFIRPQAREDILRQFAWYLDEKDSPRAAREFLGAVESAVEEIARHPDIGAPRWFENPKLKGLRSWPVPRFSAIRIYYLHSKDEIRVVRILHGKRDVRSILEDATDETEQ